jgi:hypothetical protein
VPRPTQVSNQPDRVVVYGTLTLCGRSLQNRSTNAVVFQTVPCGSWTLQPLAAVGLNRRRKVWAAPRSLATTSGMISLPRSTEMFQFPRCPLPHLWIQRGSV